MLNAADILKVDDSKREAVDVPEWGGKVFVRTMTARARDHLEARFSGGAKNMVGFRAAMVAATACDENGALLFTVNDESVLADKSASAINRIVDISLRLNGFSDGDVEELAKN